MTLCEDRMGFVRHEGPLLAMSLPPLKSGVTRNPHGHSHSLSSSKAGGGCLSHMAALLGRMLWKAWSGSAQRKRGPGGSGEQVGMMGQGLSPHGCSGNPPPDLSSVPQTVCTLCPLPRHTSPLAAVPLPAWREGGAPRMAGHLYCGLHWVFSPRSFIP